MAVSILAPLARGALRRIKTILKTRHTFQSSPPLQGGRYNLIVEGENPNFMFQSSPPLQGGRYKANMRVAVVVVRFNPRPPCKGGATP